VEDAAQLRSAGYALVICNRRDEEVEPAQGSDAMQAAIEAEGLQFLMLPLNGHKITAEAIFTLSQILQDPPGRILAYSGNGSRSALIWALAEAPERGADAVLDIANRAGHDLHGFRPTIEELASLK
jgi:uncharacterized protein (TIGR01244 family)